jgi:flagellar motor protein MotB
MKKLFFIQLSLIVFLCFSPFIATGQFYFLEDANDQIELEFYRKKIETQVNKSFFNAVKIKNPSNQTVSFLTNFSYPNNWSFIGEKNQQLSLAPNDSIIIPFRVATSIDAKGEIGYAIVVTLSDLNGKPFKNEYSFVNIPKIKNFSVRPVNRIEYFDQNSNTASINLQLNNNGNTDEYFYLTFELDESIQMQGSQENLYRTELMLRPYTDTLLSYPVYLNKKQNIQNKKFHKINLQTVLTDTTFYRTLWIKELESSYSNLIPENYKMLTIEFNASNIFSTNPAIYEGLVYGNILFKNSNLKYSLNYHGSGINTEEIEKIRFLLEYSNSFLQIKVGDISPNLEQNLYGKGGDIKISLKNNEVYLGATYLNASKRFGVGGRYDIRFKKTKLGAGYSYADDQNYGLISNLGFISLENNSKNIGNINLSLAGSQTLYMNEMRKGYGAFLNYNLNIKKTKFTLNAKYGSPEYAGRYKGKAQINSLIFQPINSKSSLNFNYNFNYTGSQFYNSNQENDLYNLTEQFQLNYNYIINKYATLTSGPYSDHFKQTQIYQGSVPFNYETRNILWNLSAKLRGKNPNNSFNLGIRTGYNFSTDYSQQIFDTLKINKNWFNMILSANFRSKFWGVYSSFYNGPINISQQYNYFAFNYYTKSLRIFPYVNLTIIPKYLNLYSKLNFTHDITAKTNRVNFINEILSYPYHNIKLSFLSTINYQGSKDMLTDEKFSYLSTYYEMRIVKDFDFNQKRYQYHDLNVHFFKDLNGNFIKDKDEPGIQNVLFSIHIDEKIISSELDEARNYFMANELLSDINGTVSYKNIPNGFYIIEFQPMGTQQGAYSSLNSYQEMYIGKDETLYIPFFEKNKIFGKVVLNRSKLSNLGVIDVSNIKVTAEDSYGKKYSSLTDKDGNFTIYVPNVDRYKVRVNNIFFENFELEQNDYEVQLNGYRQFEVNFIFNEKKRKINFTASYDYGSRLDGPGVEIVRRTNLAGTIKDATTLQPIAATIRIIDGQGNEITSANSNAKTGVFTTSFIAGDDYNVEVMADDYWFYAEKLYSNQIVTFKNLKKDILIKAITVGSIIPMNTLNFNSGSAEIPATSFPELERLLKVLRKNPSVKIDVHGHADDLEIRETQEDLALERAKIIAKYLIANGYNRVKYTGHANTKPIADNDTETGRAQNRRVEIVVTGK